MFDVLVVGIGEEMVGRRTVVVDGEPDGRVEHPEMRMSETTRVVVSGRIESPESMNGRESSWHRRVDRVIRRSG